MPIHRPCLRVTIRPPRRRHHKMECRGAVKQPILVVFLRRMGVISWPLDDRDDMSLEIDNVTAQPSHRSTDTVDCEDRKSVVQGKSVDRGARPRTTSEKARAAGRPVT